MKRAVLSEPLEGKLRGSRALRPVPPDGPRRMPPSGRELGWLAEAPALPTHNWPSSHGTTSPAALPPAEFLSKRPPRWTPLIGHPLPPAGGPLLFPLLAFTELRGTVNAATGSPARRPGSTTHPEHTMPHVCFVPFTGSAQEGQEPIRQTRWRTPLPAVTPVRSLKRS